jgi:hypothetical protein
MSMVGRLMNQHGFKREQSDFMAETKTYSFLRPCHADIREVEVYSAHS